MSGYPAVPPPPPEVQPMGFDHEGIRTYLRGRNYPPGLIRAFQKSCAMFPLRFFIVDDSGSMVSNDGHQLVGSGSQVRSVPCSRWSELTESLRFHAGLAEAGRAPTEFRLLNGAEPIVIGLNDGGFAMSVLTERFNGSPNGGTPLCHHIREVTENIRQAAPQLRAQNQKACIVIATDGESSDGDIATAMRPLRDLPCWVVIRLCTDDDRIVNYWNNIDNELELDMDVLDDFSSEAAEIMEHNDWLVYGEPLHRLREWGVRFKEIDLLDEAPLSVDQMRFAVAMILFDCEVTEIPSPLENYKAFEKLVKEAMGRVGNVWNPVEHKPTPWIRMTRLSQKYDPHPSSCSIM